MHVVKVARGGVRHVACSSYACLCARRMNNTILVTAVWTSNSPPSRNPLSQKFFEPLNPKLKISVTPSLVVCSDSISV